MLAERKLNIYMQEHSTHLQEKKLSYLFIWQALIIHIALQDAVPVK